MLSDRAIYLEMQRVKAECLFVDRINRLSGASDVILIELSGALKPYLPKARCVLVIESTQISVERVRTCYHMTVVTWLAEALHEAQALGE